MKHNTPLAVISLFGVAAVGTLLVLGGEGARGPRAARDAAVEGTRGSGARTPVRVPRILAPPARPAPHLREPPGDPSPAVGIEELVSDLVRPDLGPAERIAKARELERRIGYRASLAVRERLLGMLATAEPRFRDQIADVLGNLKGDVETAQALVGMWKGLPPEDTTRDAILTALGRMRVPEVTTDLMASVGEGLPGEPLLIRTIGRLATPRDLEQLLARLDRPLRAASRTEIERVLGEREGFFDRVAAALDSAKLQKRRSLLRILASSTDPEHAKRMRDLLGKSIDAESRGLVIRALGKHGDPESAKVLLGLVQRGSAEDRRRAAQAISSIRDGDTVALLATDWRRLDGEGRAALLGAMARLPAPTDGMIGIARAEGLLDAEPRVRQSAARVLGGRGRDDNVEALARFLARSAEPAESAAALAALDGIGTRKAALAAIRGLESVRDEVSRDRWHRRFERILNGNDA